ncbi:MAG: hypothetical protein NT018_01510 [Armatimonadetes bacterium]|nr:hypothetical protein [Armatimonadota bacterium]
MSNIFLVFKTRIPSRQRLEIQKYKVKRSKAPFAGYSGRFAGGYAEVLSKTVGAYQIAQSAVAHIACPTGAFTVFNMLRLHFDMLRLHFDMLRLHFDMLRLSKHDLLLAHQPIKGGAQRVGAMLNVSERLGLGCEIVESELQAFLEAD